MKKSAAVEQDRRRYKQPVTYKNALQNRSMASLQIRKEKKDERMEKARGRPPASSLQQQQSFSGDDATTVIKRSMDVLKHWSGSLVPGSTPPSRERTEMVLKAMEALHHLLVTTKNPPVQEIINAGVLVYLALFLKYDHLRQLQSITMSTLTTITSSTCHAPQVFQEPGVVDQLVHLLMSPDVTIREQCAWLLANFVGGDRTIENREVVLANPDLRRGVVENLQNPTTTLSLMLEVVQLLRNLTRLRPIPRRDQIDFVLVPLAKAIDNNPLFFHEPHLLSNALWVFANLSHEDDSGEGRIKAVMAAATPEMLTGIVDHVLKGPKDPSIFIPAIRTLGNFVSGTAEQCQAVLDAQPLFLTNALKLMQHPSVPVQKEVCFVLSNVCAGTEDQIMSIFYHHLDEPIIHMALSSHWEVRKETIWAICNICVWGSNMLRSSMVAKGALEALSHILSTIACDKTMIMGVLEAFEKLLEYSQVCGRNVPILLDEAGGIGKLEALQDHPDDDVYNKSKWIIEKFFGNDDDAEGDDDGMDE